MRRVRCRQLADGFGPLLVREQARVGHQHVVGEVRRFGGRNAGGQPGQFDVSLKAGERSAFRQLAGALGLPFRLLDVSASADTLARRVAERASRSNDPSEATAEVLSFQLATREPLQPDELPLAVHVDTDRPVDADAVVRALLGDGPCGPD